MKLLTTIRNTISKTFEIGKTPKNYRWVNAILWAYVYLFAIYNIGWMWNWYVTGVVVLSDLISLGTLMFSPAAMAALMVFLKIKTDRDGNKIPDFLEDKNESNRRERVEGKPKPGDGSRPN